EAKRVLIQVEDNGIGMRAPLIEHAFDLFTQAERSADRSQGGLGIGLALVRSLVELHGGAVFAASPGQGLGSTFTVSLPLFAGAPPPAAEPESAPAPARGNTPRRVLVVDDNVDAADMLGAFVHALGYEVDLAHDADTALETARRHPPGICLLDIGLPDTDGYELARRLRADPATEHATLVAVTGYGQERDRARAAEAGFDHYLIKPVATDKLAELLKYGRVRSRPAAMPS
ncbi:MAG TPA: response regulator, partial [Telluria sp.]|nr:response regulator [Telluria sp.]